MRLTLDSNILVYAADLRAGDRHTLALDLIERAAHADCVLALQSLAEFFNVATRKAGLPAREVAVFVEDWRAVFPVHVANEQSLEDAIGAVHRHGLSFWDAMIWAVARQADCRLLLSEDLQDGRTLGGVTFVNPFVPSNATLIDAALPSR